MTRDYSKFLPPDMQRAQSDRSEPPLKELGWQSYFMQQSSVVELAETPPVRIIEVHRNALHVIGDDIDVLIPPLPDATVGDWVLLNHEQPQHSRVLERKSIIQRRAPGSDRQIQLIAANIDTAFIVSSFNQDFNVARLERYIALALDADITAVIVLTKADLTSAPEDYIDQAQAISDLVTVIALDARGDEPKEKLSPWCKPGKTVAFLGSSGVGKSTLTNALAGDQSIETQAIREDDAKGRHTTSNRQLYSVPGGCLVLDTPGMRELQLTDATAGIGDLFSDIRDYASQCRFRDCQHETEPGCEVRDALERGDIDEARLKRWRKLIAEEAFNSANLAQRRKKDKEFGKMIRLNKMKKPGKR